MPDRIGGIEKSLAKFEEKFDQKIDKLTDLITIVAVQQKDIDLLSKENDRINRRVDATNARVNELENVPKKTMLVAAGAVIVAIIDLFFDQF